MVVGTSCAGKWSLTESAATGLAVKPCSESGNFNSASACPALERSVPWHNEIDPADPERPSGNRDEERRVGIPYRPRADLSSSGDLLEMFLFP